MIGRNYGSNSLATRLRDLADRVADLDPAELAGALEAMKVQIVLTNLPAPMPQPSEDRLLTIDEAAERLGVTRGWLRRRPDLLPFVVKLSDGVVRYSAHGLERYIRRHMAAK